jgi:uncharacterized circularly permuted ATP-grasp superfamily protein
MIQEAIDTYHGLLTDELAAETQERLNLDQRARNLYFGSRPLCTVLRPHFYEPDQWNYLKCETEVLLKAFGKAHAACMADSDLRAQLFLEPYEEALFSLDPGFEVPWTTSRLDSFFDLHTGNMRCVEYNAETPAGMAYEDQLAEAFLNLDLMKRFQKHYVVRSFAMRQGLLASLHEVYRQSGGKESPQIGIIDWADVPTLSEHEMCRIYFEEKGTRSLLADPRALEYHDGHLWAGGFRIDVIYKRVLCSELIDRMGMDNPIVRAVRDRAVVMSNAFSAKLMAKKASFAVLSDERNGHLFDATERAAIEAHIPWTRHVEERKSLFHGQEIDLLPFVAEHPDRFVLKPNDEYGGKGVVIGWEASPEMWLATLRQSLTTPYVVQERVHIAHEDFPTVIDGRLDISTRLVDADPFIFFGRTASGCLTRLSSVTLLNVTAGGGSVVPTFVVYKQT